ncbi:branched-chain amino acid transport system substrate-binding protein [Terribacillus halophilus]|uniref:Branched-chain amino acid transport system substrate-binding protein n=1 Tax=Terribacillus halophilus TaxID=361279 RepID=A0A1G6IVX7_9BACI|nr:hypothetical protein [Terribacillus halophilus]SDC10644.1 branched-chain amino acid transport system substrate-binding protein [Terribacillus halophilus]
MSLVFTSILALSFLVACGNTDTASGGSATLGEAIKNGAAMAVQEEKAAFEEAGLQVELTGFDDQGDP